MLNFSDSHNYYIADYRYIYKTDNQVYHNDGHPDLSKVCSPQTKKSPAVYRHLRKGAQQSKDVGGTGNHKPKLAKKLSDLKVSDSLVRNNIRRDTELIYLANFILTKSSEYVNELFEKTRKMQDAAEKL